MTDISLAQEIRLGLGGIALWRKHADLIPGLRAFAKDATDLWDSIVPPDAPAATTPIHETIAAHLTPEEKAQFDQAGQISTGGM